MNVGERIKELRLSKGLTQKQLGEKIGRSTISVRKYESGEVIPPYDVMEDIAKALDTTTNNLTVFIDEIEAFFHPTVEVVVKMPRERGIKCPDGMTVYELLSPNKIISQVFDLGYLLEHQKKAYYNGHLLNEGERQRALDMLKLLFPEYKEEKF